MLHSHWFVCEDLQQGLILFILVFGSVNIHQMLGFFPLYDQLHANKRAYFTISESWWLASGFSTITAGIWWEAEEFAESNAESLPAVVIAEEGLHNVMKWEEAEPWGTIQEASPQSQCSWQAWQIPGFQASGFCCLRTVDNTCDSHRNGPSRKTPWLD